MNTRSTLIMIIPTMILISSLSILITSDIVMLAKGENNAPTLSEVGAYSQQGDDGTEYLFTVIYSDPDGDEGTVLLHIDSNDPVLVRTIESEPEIGQYHEAVITDMQVSDNSEFRFSANDTNGSMIYFPALAEDPLLFGDFDGWGEPPVLADPNVYFDGDDWVFNITYTDPDGNEARTVQLILEDEIYLTMATADTDPISGQVFTARVLEDQVNESTQFYFSTDDVNGSYSDLYAENNNMFVVEDVLVPAGNGSEPVDGNGGGNGGGDGNGVPDGKDDNGSSGSDAGFAEGWLDNPEVMVGIIGLVAIGCGSAYGVYHRRKKHGRFSELLTKLDDVHTSYKMNPTRIKSELKKMRATINEDLKKGVIDDTNYTILKDRIDEIQGEIKDD